MSADPTLPRMPVLDAYQGVARCFADWESLDDAEAVVFLDHEPDPAGVAGRLTPFDVLVLTRERTPLRAESQGSARAGSSGRGRSG